jgi:hypothetical protein
MEKQEKIQNLLDNNTRTQLNEVATVQGINGPLFTNKEKLATAIVEAEEKSNAANAPDLSPEKINELHVNLEKDDFLSNENGSLKDEATKEKLATAIENIENAAPLVLTQEDIDQAMNKEAKNETYIEQVRSASVHYNNGKNEWVVIQKTYNNTLGYQHMTMAMPLGTRGLLVCVMEALDGKTTMSTQYIDNGVLAYEIKDAQKSYYIK